MARMLRLNRMTANGDNPVLVNPDNVAYVRPLERSGSRLYLTFATGENPSAETITVRETLDEVEALVDALLPP